MTDGPREVNYRLLRITRERFATRAVSFTRPAAAAATARRPLVVVRSAPR